jgi:hypothetical protein
LIGAHQIEIDIRPDIEQVQDLVQHLAVLGGDANVGVKSRCLFQSPNHRSHFNGFGSGAKD